MLDEDVAMRDGMAKIADRYDRYMRWITLGRERVLRRRTLDLVLLRPGDALLEVGCGTGTLTLQARERVGDAGRVCGIDLIPRMVEISRDKAARTGIDAEFQQGSIDRLPYPDNRFDAVLCSFMIFHMSAPTRAEGLREVHRVLKPDGRLIVVDLAVASAGIQHAVARALFRWWLPHELGELRPVAERAGFGGIEIAPVNFRVFLLPILSFLRATAIKR